MKITIYTTLTCPFCSLEKEYLNSKNIAFEEKHIDQDDSARSQMQAISGGFLGVPFTHIIKEDSTIETVIGFDKNKLNQILNIS